MNARTETELLVPPMHSPAHLSNTHLDALEEETIFILREVAAAFERPTLLFSGGKDSLCLLYTSPSPRDLSTSRMPSSA